MSSPLAVAKHVIATKDTSSMPFATSVASWMCGFSWFCYGWIIPHDPVKYIFFDPKLH